MNAKQIFFFYIVGSLLLIGRLTPAMVVPKQSLTVEQLADIIEQMESAIKDISLEYEWYLLPPRTSEDLAKMPMAKYLATPKEGLQRFKLSALRSSDPNEPNSLLFNCLLLEESTTLIDADGRSCDSIIKESYNGKVVKRLSRTMRPHSTIISGFISNRRDIMLSVNLTPIGFSVFRFSHCEVTDKLPLSVVLTYKKELVRLNNIVEKVNGFNAIRVDFLQEWTKRVCIRVYFSVDHGYTPVKYEYMNGPHLLSAIDVHSLDEVADGLWFPSAGLISSPKHEDMNLYLATSKIIVNQGLTEKDFDIEFPPGTKVYDQIRDVRYVVPAEE